jgi:hypothetical protein
MEQKPDTLSDYQQRINGGLVYIDGYFNSPKNSHSSALMAQSLYQLNVKRI